MKKPDTNTIQATIDLIDKFPDMDIKELRERLILIKKISEYPQDQFEKQLI